MITECLITTTIGYRRRAVKPAKDTINYCKTVQYAQENGPAHVMKPRHGGRKAETNDKSQEEKRRLNKNYMPNPCVCS